MENGRKQVGIGGGGGGGVGNTSSSSSFTADLFGPKDPSVATSTTSTSFFGSVFGPRSTGLGRDNDKYTGSTRKQDFGSQYYGSANHANQGNNRAQKSKGASGSKEKTSSNIYYQNENVEEVPCYLSSSIYYGAQEVYSPTSNSTNYQHVFKKDGDEDQSESNSNVASRGNWWQGSLYY